MSRYAIEGDTMTGIADAVRDMRHEKQVMTPAQIEAKIRATRLGIPISVSTHINPETGEWERPEDWPDLDALAATIADGEDCVYLTYDLRKTPDYGWIGVYVRNEIVNSPFIVERGHVEDGAFVADESHEQLSQNSDSVTSTRWFRAALDITNGDVQLWRVKSSNHITKFSFGSNSTRNADCLATQAQPCVEMAGRLLHLTDLSGSGWGAQDGYTTFRLITFWTEKFAVACGGSVASMYPGPFRWGYSLQSLDLSGWDTTNWAVTNMSACWQNCYSLQSLDLSGWDTTNWAVTNMSACWQNCHSLRSLDLSGWVTTNWAVTDMSTCWRYCYSLQSLDVSGWDTTNWAVTDMSNCWHSCYSLQSLDLSGWDTTNWAVTNMNSCWVYCYSLQSLDVSGWDTTNWAVTNMSACWHSCYSLQSLDLSGWDTTNWAVTNMSACWRNCYSLQSLDLSGWDTSGWNGNIFQLTFAFMSMEELDVTPFSQAKSTTFDRVFGDPESKSIKTITGWSKIDYSGAPSSSTVPNLENLENYDGANIATNHRYDQAPKLTRQSLLNIINVLPTVSAARTITLGQTNRLKLTAAEIAAATQKGWTVA